MVICVVALAIDLFWMQHRLSVGRKLAARPARMAVVDAAWRMAMERPRMAAA